MPTDRENLFNSDYADMAKALIDAGAEFMLVGGFAVSEPMKKEVVRKTSLRDAEDALCADQTAAERLSILAELNRIGLATLGVADEPLRRSVTRKFTFRDFAARPAFVPA